MHPTPVKGLLAGYLVSYEDVGQNFQVGLGWPGRLLDMGALGIIVPMVHNTELAKAAAFAMRYPPRGGRSGGAFGVGFYGGGEYMSWADDEVFLAVVGTMLAAPEYQMAVGIAGRVNDAGAAGAVDAEKTVGRPG